MTSSILRVFKTKDGAAIVGIALVLVCLLVPLAATAQDGVPSFTPTNGENEFQHETHFLTFIGSFKAESAWSEKAYYQAIDPTNSKPTFPQWLKNNGFIGDVSQWHPYGPQIIACDLGPANGCDVPAHNPDGSLVYGDNIVNTDSHVIVLNAADLGFVRNQFIRCVPSCSAPNPKIYTYLENYPVAPFTAGGSGFPVTSGYPTAAEAAAAMTSALNRPLGELGKGPGLCPGKNFNGGACIERIADVAFEWVPPVSNPTSSTRMGTLYAYVFQHSGTDSSGNPIVTETTDFPASFAGAPILNFKAGNSACSKTAPFTCVENTIQPGDKFAPNLDSIGFKYHPGVCLVCHGGKPISVADGSPFPNGGNINGFRFLPLDTKNLMFTSDSNGEQPAFPTSVAYTDRAHQEGQLKEYNLTVLQTVPTSSGSDGTGARRVAHMREVITGWYTDPPPNTVAFNRTTQNADFIPVGWREAADGGTAPAGSEQLYRQVVSPSCRSCHFNRELSLDFGTAANFGQESDILQLASLPGCSIARPNIYSPKPGARFMPLAHITYQRYWQTPGVANAPAITPSQSDQLADHFGFGGVAGYCATNP